MTRVVGRAVSTTARRAPSRAVESRARRHKVIMESVTQEKKKLRSVICFETQPPSGYTFIPAGNPQLTTACKERCRREGLQIHAVSTTPHHKTHNLSQHVHRIGYHFPSTVVAMVCSELGLYLTSTGKTLPIYAMGRREDPTRTGSEVSQITLNTDARDAIRDLFPNIPDHDLNQIIKTAFQKGQKKVGTATELPLARRAQLAVVAHIRHVYTDYDRLLKTTSFHEARTNVEHRTLAKVIQWRGDDENGETVLEDVFREVIVISDDEDSESEEDAVSTAGPQNTSVEILPSDARTHALPTQSNAYPGQGHTRDSSEEAPPGFRFVARVPANNPINRRGFNRYQAWNRALKEYREGGAQSTEQSRFPGVLAQNQSPRYAEQCIPALETSAARNQDALAQHVQVRRRVIPDSTNLDDQAQRMPTTIPLMDRPVAKRPVGVQGNHRHLDFQQISTHQPNPREPGLTIQESPDLQILEELSGPRNIGGAQLHSIPPPRMDPIPRTGRLPQSDNRSNAPVFVSGPREKLENNAASLGRRSDTVTSPLVRPASNTQESVVPSIENHWPHGTRRTDNAHPLVRMTSRMSLRSVTPVRNQGKLTHYPEVIELGGACDQSSKRRRMIREGSRADPRPDSRIARPVGFPVAEGFGPRESYRRAELAAEHRLQDQLRFRRDFVPVEASPTVGHPRPVSYANGQHGLDARSVLDHQQMGGSNESRPLNGTSGSSISFPDNRSVRVVPAIANIGTPNPGHWHPYHGRNFYSDRPNEQWGLRRNRVDGLTIPENSPDRNLYADGFVRPVGHREPPSFEYASRHLAPETKPIGDLSQPRTRERNVPYLPSKNKSQPSVAEQRGPLAGRVPRPEHHRTFSDTTPTNQSYTSVPQIPHERPLSGGFASRSFYRPASQEQNRPVYVQAVDPRTERPPFIPDGRHFIVVD